MNDIFAQTLLYDFYGELLTERQKDIYERFVLEDLSLGEIALERGISRQGVHDMIRRCDRTLNGYEEKLHLVEKFLRIRDAAGAIEELTREGEGDPSDPRLILIRQHAKEILEEL